MADRMFQEAKCLGNKIRMLNIRILPDGTSAPSLDTNTRGVASVTRVSQGLYRLVLQDNYFAFVNAQVSLQQNASIGAGRTVKLGPVTPQAAGGATVDVFFEDGAGAVADPPAANANNAILVTLWFNDDAVW